MIEQQERLQGAENYQTWKFAMKMRLIEFDLWNTIEVENFDLESARNRRQNERALAKICLSVRPELYSIVSMCETSKDAWFKLEKIFEQKGLQRKIQLWKELLNLKFDCCKNVQDFLNKVSTIEMQLSVMGASIPEDELAVMVLMKLPESYQPLVVTLESLESEKLTMDLVSSRLLQEESRQAMATDENKDTALYMKSKQGRTTCHKKGTRKFRCYNCGKTGHIARNCRKNKRAAAISYRGNQRPANRNEIVETKSRNSESINETQNEKWYIDSGATVHMTNQESCLTENRRTIDIDIKTDSKIVKSSLHGTAK